MSKPRRFSLLEKLARLVRYKLHIPMVRNKQPAHYVARGVMVGMIWAMTPFFGIHMPLVFVTWLISRRLFGWDFSLVNGLAWTWTTNVLTIIPAFYLFYLTGRLLIGNFSDPLEYDSFKSLFEMLGEGSAAGISGLGQQLMALLTAFGAPLFVGSAVWAAVSGWLAYRLSLAFVTRYREHRARKMAAAKRARPRRKYKEPLTREPSKQEV